MSELIVILLVIGAIAVVSYFAQVRHYRAAENERAIRKSLGLPVNNSAAAPTSSGSHGVTDTSSGFECSADGGCD